MRPLGIIDWLEILTVVTAVGFAGLWILVGVLFLKHDNSVLAKLDQIVGKIR